MIYLVKTNHLLTQTRDKHNRMEAKIEQRGVLRSSFSGLAESSIARLLRKLERIPELSLRPLPRCFHTVDGRPNSRWECTAFFIGVQLHQDEAEQQRQKGQLVQACGEFSSAMTRVAGGQGWHTRDMVLSCNCFSATTADAPRTRVPASPFQTAVEAGWQPQ